MVLLSILSVFVVASLIGPPLAAMLFLLQEARGTTARLDVAAERPLHQCRKCLSGHVLRVPRTDYERLIGWFTGRRAAYRCRDCGRRFVDRPSHANQRVSRDPSRPDVARVPTSLAS
jgi:hypothetical protein